METETLKVTGMTCEGCASEVAHALNADTGVHEVVVSLSSGKAAVRYDVRKTTRDQLKLAVIGLGYGVDLPQAAPAQQSKKRRLLLLTRIYTHKKRNYQRRNGEGHDMSAMTCSRYGVVTLSSKPMNAVLDQPSLEFQRLEWRGSAVTFVQNFFCPAWVDLAWVTISNFSNRE